MVAVNGSIFVGTLLFSCIQDAVIFNGNIKKVVTIGYSSIMKENLCNIMMSDWESMCRTGVHKFSKILSTRRVT